METQNNEIIKMCNSMFGIQKKKRNLLIITTTLNVPPHFVLFSFVVNIF